MSKPYLYYIGNGIYKITINNLLFSNYKSYIINSGTIFPDKKLIISDKYDFLNMDSSEEYLIYSDNILYLYLQHTFLSNYFGRCQQAETVLLKICEHIDNNFILERIDIKNTTPFINDAIITINAMERNNILEKRKYVLDPWIRPIPIPTPPDNYELPDNHIIFKYMDIHELPEIHNECLDNLENNEDKFMSVPFSWFIWGSIIKWKNITVYKNSTLLYSSEFPRTDVESMNYIYRPRIYRKVNASPYCCGAGIFFAFRVMKPELCYDPQFIDNTNKLFCVGCQKFLQLYKSGYCKKCTITQFKINKKKL